jgi:ferritin-like protein
LKEVGMLPVEVLDVDEFIRLSEKAEHCLVKKAKNVTKLKLRTKNELYTLMVDPKKTDEVFKKLKCEIKEI